MKKIIAVILTVALLSCAFIIPVSATNSEGHDNGLYYQTFLEKYLRGSDEYLLCYEELYYSKNTNDELEWVFIHARIDGGDSDEYYDDEFCGVHVLQTSGYVPFEFGYGVYDVKENKFYDLTEVSYYNKTHDTPKYEYAFDLFKTYYKAETRYESKFKTWSVNKFGEELLNNYGYTYNELFTHYDGENPDWVLCQAKYGDFESPMITWLRIGGIGGRTIIGTSWDMPFATGYGVYDVKANEFYALEDLTDDCFRSKDNGLSADKYEGLVDSLAELNIGYMTGDANGDNKVDILDATFVQKVAGGKADIDYYQELNLDVNKDNNVDILDATAIQKYAAA